MHTQLAMRCVNLILYSDSKTKSNLLLADTHVGATWFLLQSSVTCLLHSSMHQWDPTGSLFLFLHHLFIHNTHSAVRPSCHANDLQTWRGTCMHLFPFISLSTCMRRNLYSVAGVICIILYRLPITANKENENPGAKRHCGSLTE